MGCARCHTREVARRLPVVDVAAEVLDLSAEPAELGPPTCSDRGARSGLSRSILCGWENNMEIDRHVAALEREAQLFAAAARLTDLDAPVSSCPGWDMRDLVRHLAEIHLWAAAQVSNRAARM